MRRTKYTAVPLVFFTSVWSFEGLFTRNVKIERQKIINGDGHFDGIRTGSGRILSIKGTITIDTMLNFHRDRDSVFTLAMTGTGNKWVV